jgi:tetratricopeptide (TPR) repeat protein
VLRLRKQLDLAEATYREALAIETTRQGARSAQAGLTHNTHGMVKLERRDWSGARAEFELALAILTDTKHGDRAFAEHNLGLVAAATNNHAAALASFDRAAEIYHATIGSEVLSSIRIHLDRARSLVATGQRNAARAEAMRALDDATKVNIPWIVDDAKALLSGLPAIKAARPEASQIEASPPIQWRIPPIDPPPLPPRPKPDKPAPIRDVGTYGTSPGTQ